MVLPILLLLLLGTIELGRARMVGPAVTPAAREGAPPGDAAGPAERR